MKKGFLARFGRGARTEPFAPGAEPRAEPAAAEVADVVRAIAGRGLPRARRKAAISLRIDPDVLEWFRLQGPGYQTRINAVLRAFMEASRHRF